LKEDAIKFPLPFLKFSKVIKTNEDENRIRKFFSHKPIKEAKLLFCASEYNFDIGWFHQSCDGFIDTLTVCETEHGKVIGGYTPLPWGSEKEDILDSRKESFIFSLSNNQKFTLI
jgi:hypothetical protein